ncbi:DUF4189 domain-containing protein [Xanthomonas theicola]|uniref:DUF4189 domain-containing protein n=1 Tax=Xanthomonas theicola TaxID=56464 RepID=UPI00360930EA
MTINVIVGYRDCDNEAYGILDFADGGGVVLCERLGRAGLSTRPNSWRGQSLQHGDLCSYSPRVLSRAAGSATASSGEMAKNVGAVATDGGENLGVSTGKLKKSEAEQDARKKCDGISSEKCHVAISYQNQCVSVVQPKTEGLGIVTYYHGPSTEETSRDGLLNCQKNNHDMSCEVVYTNCTEQIFQRF